MNPHQLVKRSWPQDTKRKCFDQYIARVPVPDITRALGPPSKTIYRWITDEGWAQYKRNVITEYAERAEMVGQASIMGAIACLRISAKVIDQAKVHLDKDELLTPDELAKISSAIGDSSEMLLRLLGK